MSNRRNSVDPKHPKIPIKRQCELLGVSRSGYYYKPAQETTYNLFLMDLIDRQYTEMPYYGVPRMTAWLRREGHMVNPKRIERLMRLMGIQGICPKKNLSLADEQHKKYPYLLNNLNINRPNYVWCTDITYIRVFNGFIYLVAVMDWFSRYVLSWKISNTLDTQFCLEALDEALSKGKPEIFNSDQGVQFTSDIFTSKLESEQIKISMDGKGRAFDNIMIERLWRSLKYDEIYLKDYRDRTVYQAITGIGGYFETYNNVRLHQSLNYSTPFEMHYINETS